MWRESSPVQTVCQAGCVNVNGCVKCMYVPVSICVKVARSTPFLRLLETGGEGGNGHPNSHSSCPFSPSFCAFRPLTRG